MHCCDRDQPRLADDDQSVGHHFGGRMRFRGIGGFLQIQTRAKRRSCAAQY